LPTTIAIESKTVTLRGFATPYQHLYLVKTVTDESGQVLDERVIRGDLGGNLTLEIQADIPLAQSADARGSATPEQRNHTVLNLGGRDPEAVWQLMAQHAVNADRANLEYGVDSFGFSTDGANSNTLVASALHTVGINLATNLPEGVTFNEVPLFNRLDQMVVNDILVGQAGNDLVYGGVGRDRILGGDGADRLFGETGSDHLVGGAGNDLLDGSTGIDRMDGGAGNDTFRVDDRRDWIIESDTSAAGGVDRVLSTVSFSLASRSETSGVERIALSRTADAAARGNDLDNYIGGNSGDNKLFGGVGNDTLKGSSGNDVLHGGIGSDVLKGDSGRDAFQFKSVAESFAGDANRDTILDFTSADVIDLRSIDANTLADGNQTFTFIGSAAFSGAGQLRFETDSLGNTIVQADVDGNLTADFEILLQSYTAGLSRDDFLL
jgi:Ca2+-binding RTX toxin-like protein